MEQVSLQTHGNSEKAPLDRLIEEHFSPEQLKRGLVATDMDGTMFKNDLGLLVFVESLCEPRFWHYGPKKMKKLLIPPAYEELLVKGSNGETPDLPMEECKKALVLREDIILLYEVYCSLSRKGKKPMEKRPVVIEFARKMIELDRLIMGLEPHWRSHFNGQLLMRTRFFSANKKKSIDRLIRTTLARNDMDDPNRFLALRTFPKHQESLGQSMELKDLDPIDRVIQVRKEIEMILRTFHIEHGLRTVVVTTNFDQIAKEVTQNEPYDFLKTEKRRNVKGTIVKTHESKPKRNRCEPKEYYTSRLLNVPPLGEEKRCIAQEAARRRQRILLVACGDSLAGDGAMGLQAMENGGVFIVAGDKYDETRAKFEPLSVEAVQKGVKDAANKIWYAISE